MIALGKRRLRHFLFSQSEFKSFPFPTALTARHPISFAHEALPQIAHKAVSSFDSMANNEMLKLEHSAQPALVSR